MPDNSTGVFTFYPTFSDCVTLYHGATGVWIGDGTVLDIQNKKGGTEGSLYVAYLSGEYQDLGPVLNLEAAVTYQSSDSGTEHPPEDSDQWSATPDPQKGTYLWTKIVFTSAQKKLCTYTVSYVGSDAHILPITNSEIDTLFE